MLGFVIRNSRFFKDLGCIIKLYNALVRPHLEYASVIWSPQGGVNIDLIEKVQKRFLRYLYVRKNNAYPYMVSYMSMLKSFHLITLERRRSLQAVLFIYSIVNNLKYKDLLIINSIQFLVPKINLRLKNKKIFYTNPVDCSPINAMLLECNKFIEECNVDFFNSNLGLINSCFSVIS